MAVKSSYQMRDHADLMEGCGHRSKTQKIHRMRLARLFAFALSAFFLLAMPLQPAWADGSPPPPPDGEDFVITVFLQGFYDSGTGQMRRAREDKGGGILGERWANPIAEKVTVELHKPDFYDDPEETIVYADRSLNTDGTIILQLPDFGEYYITIRTRNHLETVSANPINFETADPREYDFTTAASQAYGNNQIDLGDGVYGIYAGDINQDGVIDGIDRSFVQSELINISKGYFVEDVDGDGEVDGIDRSFVQGNLIRIIVAQRPD